MTSVEDQATSIKRRIEREQASVKDREVTWDQNLAVKIGTVKTLGDLRGASDYALALIALVSLHIPGEIIVEHEEEGDWRRFYIYRDDLLIGTLEDFYSSKASGCVGGGFSYTLTEAALEYVPVVADLNPQLRN